MPELPKPRRVDMYTAKKYIREVCGLGVRDEVNPAFYDALCNDDLYFQGVLNVPTSSGVVRETGRVPTEFWINWGYHAFNNGTLADAVVSLPDHRHKYNPPFYTNLLIETALIDKWLSDSSDVKIKVCAVPEKVYRERIETALAINTSYSRGEDREWAKANGYSVESVQEMRKLYAPKEWKEAGRRTANNLQKESAEELAG